MDFDRYWEQLIHRVYEKNEVLKGPEELVYRLTCIYGETMVDGIEAYFERRHDEYDRDMMTLKDHGHTQIAEEFAQAREVMLGDAPLTAETIEPIVTQLLEEGDDVQEQLQQLRIIYERLIEQLPSLLSTRDEIGVRNGLFTADAESNEGG